MMLDPQGKDGGKFCKGLKHGRIQTISIVLINSCFCSTNIYFVPGSVPGLEGMMVGTAVFRSIDAQQWELLSWWEVEGNEPAEHDLVGGGGKSNSHVQEEWLKSCFRMFPGPLQYQGEGTP